MFPHEHFIVAALPVFAYVAVRDGSLPDRRLVAVVFVGSQFPDLIDKPLAHQLQVLPSGRVFMHSLPFAVPIAVGVAIYGWKTGRLRAGVAFGVAYVSHLIGDNHESLLAANPTVPSDLLWPFVPAVTRPAIPFWAGPNSINVALWTTFSVVVLVSLGYGLALDVAEQLRSNSSGRG
nr:metal-dependent hydrolase [Halomicroarcula sp. ZS-22-S1]